MKTRRYKVICYIDVPVKSDQFIKDEYDMEKYISDKLAEDGIYGDFEVDKMPLPEQLEDPYDGDNSEDITDFENPVGFIAPDGKFYGMESKDDGLAHLALAHDVYEYYLKDSDNVEHSTYGIDYTLELNGFIKIHGTTARYHVEPWKTSNVRVWTSAQCNTVYKWMVHMEKKYNDCHGIIINFEGFSNGRWLTSKEFSKMSDAEIIKCFVDNIM